jgi:superfamily II DNA or RNA helicase
MTTEFRYYQEEADEAIFEELKENNKCLVKMFCGTGKSRLMRYCRIAQNKKLVVYVVPSLSLLDQFYTDYLQDFPLVKKISSEEGSTTESEEILNYLKKDANKIICVTYQSFETLVNLLGDIKIDVCIFDEAHHVVGKIYQTLIFESDVCEKQIFFTATPKNANGVVMYDKDNLDAGMCGKLVYDYSYFKGEMEGYLNPFEIRIDFYTENTVISLYESIARAILESGNTRILTFHADVNGDRDASVLRFVDQVLFIVAFNNVLESEFPEKVGFYKKVKMIGLSAEINMHERKHILKQFDEIPDNEIMIISSCQTIGEGIDTKNANMCVFVDPKSSFVAITQNIGRIVRKNPDILKPRSTILIPCWVDKDKYLGCDGDKDKCDQVIREEMNKDGNFNGILNVMSALKQESEDLYDACLHYPDTYSPQEIEGNLFKHGYQLGETVGDGLLVESLEHMLDTEIHLDEDDLETDEELLVRVAEENNVVIEVHSNSLETPIEYYGQGDLDEEKEVIRIFKLTHEETEETMYKPIVKKNKTKRNTDVLKPLQRENRLNVKVHTNPDVKVLWNLSSDLDLTKDICSCIIDCEVVDMWPQRFEELKAFIDENKKRPSDSSKISNEKQLGGWLCNQLTNYKNKQKSMKDEAKFNLWTQFLVKYKDHFISNDKKWLQTLEELKDFICKYNKRPSAVAKICDEKKLGQWLTDQLKIYKNKQKSMKDEARYNLWVEFLKDYEKIFIINDEIWFQTLEELKSFISKYNKRPLAKAKTCDEKRLGGWLSHQLNNYKNNISPMTNTIVKNYWTEFLKEHEAHFITYDEKWDKQFNQLKTFIIANKRIPSQISKKPDEKILGKWLSTNKNNYNIKKDGMKNEERRAQWDQFLKEYINYSKFSQSVNDEELEIIVKPKQKRSAKLPKITQPPEKKVESKEDIQIRTKSLITQFHNKFCKMRSDNLAQHFQQTPSDFAEYHRVRDECFQTFELQDIPCERIIQELEKIKKGGKHVIDMGCGTAKIAEHFSKDSRFQITSYDHIAINDNVQVCDISHMPLEDGSVDICIMSLALWGSNCDEYIREALRVLDENGILYIIDSTKRWSEEGSQDAGKLKLLLETNGFQIKAKDTKIDKWCYFKCMK